MPLHLSFLEILSEFKLNQFVIQVLAHPSLPNIFCTCYMFICGVTQTTTVPRWVKHLIGRVGASNTLPQNPLEQFSRKVNVLYLKNIKTHSNKSIIGEPFF